ncbi:MAG: hypothetical protein K2K79_06075 [Paramuribaculum sp.]|nr:hypothetical protein [Paramuribaculum sp.]
MKRLISAILLLICVMTGFAQSAVDNDFEELSTEDQSLLIKAIGMVDDGLSEAVTSDFDYLVSKYPKNYIVRYERAYNNALLERYGEVIKDQKLLLNHKLANERTYQLIGNAYDFTGNRKKAANVYRDGLKRFPQSGSLNMEIGNLYYLDKDYNKALEYYNLGIVAEPNFASNYYRAAMLYLCTDVAKVWGLVYAESAILLAPSNESRHQELAETMMDCLKESITMSFDGESRLSVKLVPGQDIKIDDKSKTVYLGFPGIYEAAIMKPLMKMQLKKIPFTANIQQLIDLRRGAVENYYSATGNLFGSSMYLLEFQKKIIDAGHWDAYNYFLFMPSNPEEFGEWYESHSDELNAFIDWYNNDPYILGDGRSVDIMQIYNHYRPITLPEALRIQASLVADKKLTDSESNTEVSAD